MLTDDSAGYGVDWLGTTQKGQDQIHVMKYGKKEGWRRLLVHK